MNDTKLIPELYGSLVFNDKVMRERLPKDIYKSSAQNDPERYPSGAGRDKMLWQRP